MNDNPAPTASPVPSVSLRHGESFVEEIERLMRRAAANGSGTLAHLLECALVEARREVAQRERDLAEREAALRDLYRPEVP